MSQKKIKVTKLKMQKEDPIRVNAIREALDKTLKEKENKTKNNNIIISMLYDEKKLSDQTSYAEKRKLAEENGFETIGRFNAAIDKWKSLKKQEEALRKEIERRIQEKKDESINPSEDQSSTNS